MKLGRRSTNSRCERNIQIQAVLGMKHIKKITVPIVLSIESEVQWITIEKRRRHENVLKSKPFNILKAICYIGIRRIYYSNLPPN